ncbi:hypothetical protein I302_104586 [Kwoniella bestiolae CBS 10118]|uniref:Uncharacterized protein n=1 Tax=Kwoniella bestiolae CBS 10118 TaxID=1296100 RepID=A0A1B9GBN4_9TREE|nr:hypothetical protein I302_03292 [Kwoniella bestiolae CBS 10118]OCF28433.1 hypothetical protein I302_03292 [Kwoniella bestiolae CBS 10118]
MQNIPLDDLSSPSNDISNVPTRSIDITRNYLDDPSNSSCTSDYTCTVNPATSHIEHHLKHQHPYSFLAPRSELPTDHTCQISEMPGHTFTETFSRRKPTWKDHLCTAIGFGLGASALGAVTYMLTELRIQKLDKDYYQELYEGQRGVLEQLRAEYPDLNIPSVSTSKRSELGSQGYELGLEGGQLNKRHEFGIEDGDELASGILSIGEDHGETDHPTQGSDFGSAGTREVRTGDAGSPGGNMIARPFVA